MPPASAPFNIRFAAFPGGRAWLLANPHAGRGYGRAVGEAIRSGLSAIGWTVAVHYERPEVAVVPEPGIDVVIVVGGDGTLRAAVQRVLSCFSEVLPPVLPVPMGTANLVGQYLGLKRGLLDIGLDGMRGLAAQVVPPSTARRLPRLQWGSVKLDPRRVARRVLRRLLPPPAQVAREQAQRVVGALQRGAIHRIDVGCANGQPFLLMAGIGFDAHVVSVLDERRSGPIGLLSYAVPAAAAVARYGFPPVRVEVDGVRVFGPKPAVVMIANLPQYGTGFPIVPGALADDGLLDVLCLPCGSRVDLGKIIALAADGRHLGLPGVVKVRGKAILVDSVVAVPVQIDGDPGGRLPLRVIVMDRQVPFVKPGP